MSSERIESHEADWGFEGLKIRIAERMALRSIELPANYNSLDPEGLLKLLIRLRGRLSIHDQAFVDLHMDSLRSSVKAESDDGISTDIQSLLLDVSISIDSNENTELILSELRKLVLSLKSTEEQEVFIKHCELAMQKRQIGGIRFSVKSLLYQIEDYRLVQALEGENKDCSDRALDHNFDHSAAMQEVRLLSRINADDLEESEKEYAKALLRQGLDHERIYDELDLHQEFDISKLEEEMREKVQAYLDLKMPISFIKAQIQAKRELDSADLTEEEIDLLENWKRANWSFRQMRNELIRLKDMNPIDQEAFRNSAEISPDQFLNRQCVKAQIRKLNS